MTQTAAQLALLAFRQLVKGTKSQHAPHFTTEDHAICMAIDGRFNELRNEIASLVKRIDVLEGRSRTADTSGPAYDPE